MFGEFSGAVGAADGPQSGSESRISNSILPLNSAVIAGLTLVVDPRDTGCDYSLATSRKSPQDRPVLGAFVTCGRAGPTNTAGGYLAFSRISTSRPRLG